MAGLLETGAEESAPAGRYRGARRALRCGTGGRASAAHRGIVAQPDEQQLAAGRRCPAPPFRPPPRSRPSAPARRADGRAGTGGFRPGWPGSMVRWPISAS